MEGVLTGGVEIRMVSHVAFEDAPNDLVVCRPGELAHAFCVGRGLPAIA